MRRILTATGIVLAALGLFWLVRLERAPSGTRTRQSPSQTSGSASPTLTPVTTPAETDKPVVASHVLGRVGGRLPSVLVDPRILVEKSRRTLTVFSNERPVKTYRIALGRKASGDKDREGDLRTPEGDFYVCAKNESSKFHRALGLSYPNNEDADRGLAAGLISKREQRAIVDAVRHYRRPPWNTRLGGEIMIHGGGVGSDWTTGCIALSNADIEELFGRVPMGTPVEVRP